jgi:ubiquinone/menaquinone biosynthesis C-methylase UbiE
MSPQRAIRHAPAISDPAATAAQPLARRLERDALVDSVPLAAGMTVLDLQAADGYLADEVRRRLHGQATCICLEPTPELNGRIDPAHRVCAEPLNAFPSIADDSVDAALGLAGLHHSPDIPATLRELRRVLKPAGTLAICDVEAGSPMASWLNEFVDRHGAQGHQGQFLPAGGLAAALRAAGFVDVAEKRRDVPWHFASRPHLLRFFKGLFGLVCDEATVAAGIDRHLSVSSVGDGIEVAWFLNYVVGRKAATA